VANSPSRLNPSALTLADAARLLTAVGGQGDVGMLAGNGRRADRVDNRWLDCLVGCAVAASLCGASVPGLAEPKPKRRVSHAERYAKWRANVG
jgi:hypothetical protein